MEKIRFENISREKQESWQQMLDRIDRMADRRGKGVDPGIKEMVAVLNCMELTTDGSCEGHVHEGESPPPWIHFDFVPTQLRYAVRQARQELRPGEKTNPHLEALLTEARLKLLRGQARIVELLDEFYSGRRSSAETRLGITFYPDSARLESQGADLQELYPSQIQSRKLRAYQDEMRDFAEFLKAKFFSEKA